MTDPIAADDKPIPVELEEGKDYWWCACGRSASQPYCDGSHKQAGKSPVKFVAESSGAATLCICKRTATPPYCDGTRYRCGGLKASAFGGWSGGNVAWSNWNNEGHGIQGDNACRSWGYTSIKMITVWAR